MTTIEKRLQEMRDAGILKREASVDASSIDVEARTVAVAFSSEAEYERYWGIEILDHDPGAVRMERLLTKAPALWNHNRDDMRGVVEAARIDGDRMGRAVLRFSKSPAGDQLFQDIIDGIVTKVSVGYLIHEAKLVEERDGLEVWRVTDWEPFEISMVSIPADNSVGVGRSAEIPPQEPEVKKPENQSKLPVQVKERTIMTPEEIAAQAAEQARAAGTEAERARVRKITEAGERFGHAELAREFVANGKTTDEFRDALLEKQNQNEQRSLNDQSKTTDIGLTNKEARAFSLLKVVRALVDPTDRRAQEDAAFEFEASRTAAGQSGRDTTRFLIPTDVLTRAMNSTTGGATNADTGGYSIANTMLASSFIDILRNKAVLMQHGRTIGGLKGTIDIPKQTAAAQGYWLGEDDDAGETGIGLGQITMSPKTVAAFSEITRKLANQSSLDVEAMLRYDLATQLALTIDKAGFYAIGSDHQPQGLSNQTGINAKPFTTAGAPTYAELVDMETQVALSNADVESMVYIANAGMRGKLKTTLKFPTSASDATIWEPGGTVNGYATDITNQVNAGDVFFGNFADLLIGMWGGLELTVDPYSGSKKGRIRIVAFQDVDVAVRRTASFCIGR